MKLYQISQEIAAILGEEDAELSDDVATRLGELELALEEKVEAVLQYRAGLEAEAEALKAEAERLKAKADGHKRKGEWLRSYLLDSLQKMGVGKVSTRTFNATVAKSPPSVDGTIDVIPDEFARVVPEKRELDKKAIIEAWKAGKTLPEGLTVKQGFNLRIS